MPIAPLSPGVYIEEIKSPVRTIIGVPTSVTAFVGRALRGAIDEPIVINNWGDFERRFGGLWSESTLSYAVRDFYSNGGSQAVIVRLHNGGKAATVNAGGLKLRAKSPGDWGEKLRVRIEHRPDPKRYDVRIRDAASGADEAFRNVSVDPTDLRSIDKVLTQSNLVELDGATPSSRPAKNIDAQPGIDPLSDKAQPNSFTPAQSDGDDGSKLTSKEYLGDRDKKTGIYSLLKLETQVFNLVCIPPVTRTEDVAFDVLSRALELCVERRAMLLVDAPSQWSDVQAAATAMPGLPLLGNSAKNAAMFFPRVRISDPLQDNRLDDFAPCGLIAGAFARTDRDRGVWKAPAGIDASLNTVSELSVSVTDDENGQLNPLGLNCLRRFPVIGRVIWGARTLRGADMLADEWKYIPIRRLALYIEESLFRGTQWVVFEPNDEPLWAQIRLNVGAFMHSLFRQGAFQGRSSREAYFVKCDRETTTQDDINRGVVNILVGFAPLKPAEFVIIKIQQIAGQIET